MHRPLRRLAISLISATLVAASLGLNPPEARASTGFIHGWVFNDLDRDGTWDTGEPSMEGRPVVCRHGYGCDHTEWGEFMWDELEPGTYLIKLVDYSAGFRPTTPRTLRIVLGQDEYRLVHFGLTAVPRRAK